MDRTPVEGGGECGIDGVWMANSAFHTYGALMVFF